MAETQYALITGASSGIGEGFARALARRGRSLILVARSADKLEALASVLRAAHSVEVVALPSDLSVRGSAATIARQLAERGLQVDLLINNAGFGARGLFWDLSLDRQLQMMRLNIGALVELTHLLLPPMIAARRGTILNVSSTAGFQPMPYTAVYGATKAFVTAFSEALREELREFGVKVVTLCPGGTRTNFFQASGYERPGLLAMMDPEKVIETGLRAIDGAGGIAIPGFLNKLLQWSQRLVPRSFVVKFTARMYRP
jgi:hypothetical protein